MRTHTPLFKITIYLCFLFCHQNNELLDVTGLEYKEETKKIGSLVHYQSQLTVYNTNKTDYGPYTCMAHNELGTDTYEISLDGTSMSIAVLT